LFSPKLKAELKNDSLRTAEEKKKAAQKITINAVLYTAHLSKGQLRINT
jgi:hypothetical protein